MDRKQVASFMEASGVVLYNMTNNYMFRYILQKNEKVLKGIICSLLHLNPEQIMKVEITNPINLSGDITGKEFILDSKDKELDETMGLLVKERKRIAELETKLAKLNK